MDVQPGTTTTDPTPSTAGRFQPGSRRVPRPSPHADIEQVHPDRLWPSLGKHHFTSLFSSGLWIEALIRTYSFDIQSCTRFRQGGAEAAILFSLVRDLRGDRIVCLPFSDYCDPLVDDTPSWNALIEPLLERRVPVRLRCLHNAIPMQDSRFRIVKNAKWHATDLRRSREQIWASLSPQARQNVRHAQRSGIVIRAGSTFEDARAFYELHVHTRKYKYHLLPQPFQFFHHLVEIFAPSNRILVLIAELDGKPVAGLLLLQWDNKLYYKFNASSSRHARPNEMLIWHALLAGHERGLDRLDFGISDLDQPGLVAFKRKFATEERDVHFLEANPYGYRNEQGEQAQRLLGQLTRLLTLPSVPDEVTTAAGDELYRFFA